MILALSFLEPLLLLGLLAVAIPLVLHLLARSRAQEMLFPTLRFLRISMERTARRRRIQQVLLMFLRMALLALFVLAVAEPISQALGGWMSGKSFACVLVVDNSMSMSAASGAGGRTRLDAARAEAKGLLSLGREDRPAVAALWTTNGPPLDGELTDGLDKLRDRVDRIAPSFGRAPLAQRVAAAVAALAKQSTPQKAVVVFSDLQKITFDELAAADDLAKAADVHLLVINAAERPAVNVGVTDVKVEGRPIADQLQTVTATVENASPTQMVRDLVLRVGGEVQGQKVHMTLAAAGEEGCKGVAKFNWWPRQKGTLTGEVALDGNDDLAQDNQRSFAVQIGGHIQALVVRGPAADPCQPASDPAWMLNLALNPFSGDPAAGWMIDARTVDAQDFAPASLASAEIVFLCDVPKFTNEQASALESLAAGGGTVVIFCGPNVDVANYNAVLGRPAGPEGGLLPAPLTAAVGDVGPAADAVFFHWVDLEHPYFKGLWKDLSDVKRDIRGFVRRRYGLQLDPHGTLQSLSKAPRPPEVLVGLESNEPLIVSKPFGQGRVVLCTTSASAGWSNLPGTSLFPPMVIRMGLLARRQAAPEGSFLAESPVTIRPRLAGEANEVPVEVTLPLSADGKVQTVTLRAVRTAEGLVARLTQADAAGIYQWRTGRNRDATPFPEGNRVASLFLPDDFGAFAVNPPGDESLLQPMTPDALRAALAARGFNRVYVGRDFAEAKGAALEAAQKRNWWDVLAALAIVALVVESLVANRARKPLESAVPAHLNPKIAA